jgi:xylan 1,4-beta-xylosidase
MRGDIRALRRLKAIAACLLFVAIPVHAQTIHATARFEWFDYRGDDALPKPGPGKYANPILQGFYPDPSIVRVGSDYYLVNSTFVWFPGMPVFHSRDLVHWTQIGNAFDRSSQLKLGKLGMGQGLYAPDISWHDGTFYLVNTCVGCGDTFIMTARNAAGPWSDPIFLPDLRGAIDPSIFFDADGTAWVVNNGPPPEKPRYEGHRALWLQQLDPKTLKMLGPRRVLVDGGVHPEQNPIWIEGPHIFRKDGFYYLIAAEGGTAENHSEVVFRSRHVAGPYVALASNPILTQRDLPKGRPNPITSTGHAKFVETPAGEWWAVFLGVRPYDAAGDFNTGRETFMLPVQWRDGWPRITEPGERVPWIVKRPNLAAQLPPAVPTHGAFAIRENFDRPRLAPYWMMLRNPVGHWWRIRGGALELNARDVGLGDYGNPSFLARRQQHLDASATTEVRFEPASDAAEAGIVAFQNDEDWYFLGVGRDHGKRVLRLRRRAGADQPANGTVIAESALPGRPNTAVQLRISAHGASYDFAWSTDGRHWRTLLKGAEGTILGTKKAGGFVGAVFGLYAHDASAGRQ